MEDENGIGVRGGVGKVDTGIGMREVSAVMFGVCLGSAWMGIMEW